MQDFKKRSGRGVGWQRMLGGCAIIAVLAALAFFSVRGAWGMYEKFTVAAAADEQEQAQLSELRQQEAQVSTDVQEVSTPAGIDSQVRERYGLAKPGEGEIDIVTEASSTTPATPPSESLWSWLVHAFSVF